jgi:acetyl-CoA C-acetyltransferase
MESIKDKAAIIGMGCTPFGELRHKTHEDLIVEAAYEAFEDAGIGLEDIQMAWVGTVESGEIGLSLSRPLKLRYIPVTRVENLCATGSEALRAASYAVAAGVCDIALALGFEKLRDKGIRGPSETVITPMAIREYMLPPGNFALVATRYFYHYGLSYEEGKRMLAKIAVKNHNNGFLTPKASFHRKVTIEEAMNAPMIAYPLGIYDACGTSDGAAAAIVTRADMATNFRPDPLYIKSLTIAAGPREGRLRQDYDYVHFEENIRAAKAAYADAGITNPLKELSVAEVHDCFTITEAVTCEDLDWAPRGKVKESIDAGVFELDGELPVNADGGLKCFGHPLGASGLRMMYEVYKQCQGKADERQIKNANLGLTHNLGGGPGTSVVSIFIAGSEKPSNLH